MRVILIALAAALMAACTSPAPIQPIEAIAQGKVVGFGTLADFGSWEFELAPAYTRLAVLRHRAARQLDERRIALPTAMAVQDLADRARALLDLSRRGNAMQPTVGQREQFAAARVLIADAEALLEK